ncbi:MAG: FkbM family methyltransferase [Alphaproteobacteria bacterium]
MSEREMEIVPLFARQDRISIDVGAAHGEYTSRLAKSSRFVYAFEPLYELYRDTLSPILQGNANVSILPCAVSNQAGRAVIRVPFFGDKWQPYRASISQDFAGVQHQDYDVPVVTLDSQHIDDVGFIKIDVEGNELNVVTGAMDTIRRCRPVLLIEMEQRHIPGNLITTIEVIESLGYSSYIFRNGRIEERHTLDLIEIQREGLARLDPEIYLNNIFFMPTERKGRNLGWITPFASLDETVPGLWRRYDERHGRPGVCNWVLADRSGDPGPLLFDGKLQRLWNRGGDFRPRELVRAVENLDVGRVVLHYEAGLFPPLHFDALIKDLAACGVRIVVVFSSLVESTLYLASIGLCRQLLFSTAEGLAMARGRGWNNSALLPEDPTAAADLLRDLMS